jgi:energy-coupling factor transporter ATP-binding protein EcfA2
MDKQPPPAAPAAPPPPAPPPAARSPSATKKTFAILAGRQDAAQRVVIYGPGGIGKSTLASLAPGVAYLDIEGGTRDMDVPRVEGVENFADMRSCLQSDVFDGSASVVLDTATKAEEWAVAHTIATVQNEKGNTVQSIEGYGFGKGYQHVYETFLLLLADLDRQVRNGRNVILLAHDCINDVPNPMGEDFIRYEPHLQSPKSGRASIRNRVVQWADHVLFLGYDVISEDGKGKGGGTRRIWPVERPDHIAKSRRISNPTPFANDSDGAIWDSILKGGNQ